MIRIHHPAIIARERRLAVVEGIPLCYLHCNRMRNLHESCYRHLNASLMSAYETAITIFNEHPEDIAYKSSGWIYHSRLPVTHSRYRLANEPIQERALH